MTRDEFVRRTAVTRISVNDEQRELLEATIDEYCRGCQIATEIAWPKVRSKVEVQSITYDRIREDTDLASQHVILATHQVAGAISSCQTNLTKGRKTSKPEFSAPTVTYDTRTMTLFGDHTVSLTTIEGRVRCSLVLPEGDDGYQWQYLAGDEWELAESTLTVRNGDFYLHLGFRRFCTEQELDARDESIAENGTVLGVDLGVRNLAVTSTGLFLSGGELEHWQKEYERRRGSLQNCGTRWAHENIRSVGQKEKTRFTIFLHKASNAILAEAQENECTHIAFEELDDIRDRLIDATWQHRWAFRRLFEFVSYKTLEHGICVRKVDPRYTSQRCSHTDCGFTHRDNREGENFRCVDCGNSLHADYNAAKNIAVKYAKRLRRLHKSSDGGAPVNVPLNSGSLTVTSPTTVTAKIE